MIGRASHIARWLLRHALLLALAVSLFGCEALFGRGDAELAQDMSARLEAAFPQAVVTVLDADTIRVAFDGSEGVTMHLQNVAAACASGTTTASCENAKRATISSIREVRENERNFDPSLLRPTLRPQEWLDQAVATGVQPLSRAVVPGISVVYVFDLPSATRAVLRGDLAKVHMSESQLATRALANLEHAYPELFAVPAEPGSHVMAIRTGDFYESSRLLMTSRWAALVAREPGEILATVPRRDEMFFVRGTSAADVAELQRRTAASFALGDHTIGTDVLRFTGSGWTKYAP